MKIILIKTITWRVIASIVTILVTLILTRNIKISIEVALMDAGCKTLFYYTHERFWEWYQ